MNNPAPRMKIWEAILALKSKGWAVGFLEDKRHPGGVRIVLQKEHAKTQWTVDPGDPATQELAAETFLSTFARGAL